MTIAVDMRLAIQRLQRQRKPLTLANIVAATEDWQPAVEDTILRLLRTGELTVAPTSEFIKVKAVPTTWRDDDTKARINRLFGGTRNEED